MIKISVIVAVYNAKDFIERALDSLLKQTFNDFEIIIIDDGSTDGTLQVINKRLLEVRAGSPEVKLISRENKGISLTRSEGIRVASGDYFIFLDSDDWVEQHFLSELYNDAILNDSDMVITDYFLDYDHGIFEVKNEVSNNKLEILSLMLLDKVKGFTWNKLIRRQVCLDNGLDFQPNINYMEDFIFIMEVLLASDKVSFLDKCLVHYNQENESSITKRLNTRKAKEITDALSYIEKYLMMTNKASILNYSLINLKLRNKYKIITEGSWGLYNKYFELYPELKNSVHNMEASSHVKLILKLVYSRLKYTSFIFIILMKIMILIRDKAK